MKNSEIYDLLVSISNGEVINIDELSSVEPLIERIKYSTKSPDRSIITFEFDEYEDYWGLFDVTKDDIWFANYMYSNYDVFEFEDSSNMTDSFLEGYIFGDMDNKNKELLKKICLYLSPELQELSHNDLTKISNILITSFPKECNYIIDTYQYETNLCKQNGNKKYIEKETCNVLEEFMIFKKSCFYKYFTSVGILLRLYERFGNPELTIEELLRVICSKFNTSGWYEYMHEVDCDDFDNESVNREITRQLESILEKLEDGTEFENIDEYRKFVKSVSKFNTDNWIRLPKNKSISFKILSIDPRDNTVNILISKGNEKRKLTFEQFNLFLYQPELF